MDSTNRVVHFEMPAQDLARMKKFYSDAFGWQIIDYPEMNYTVVETGPTDEKRMVQDKGFINGGFYQTKEPLPAPNIVVAVNSLDEAIDKIKAAGGQILSEKTDIPGIGPYIKVKDTEGNTIALLQATNM